VLSDPTSVIRTHQGRMALISRAPDGSRAASGELGRRCPRCRHARAHGSAYSLTMRRQCPGCDHKGDGHRRARQILDDQVSPPLFLRC
jgi:hypothetical protein